MENRASYGPARGVPLFTRIKRALAQIPPNLQPYALAVFANVVYLPESLLRETWSYLLESLARTHSCSVDALLQRSHVFEVDPSGHTSDLFHENLIEGRLDTDRFSRFTSLSEFAQGLLLLERHGAVSDRLSSEIKRVFEKDIWLLINDNVLSATSLQSEIERARALINAFASLGRPQVVPVGQVLTSVGRQAVDDIRSALFFDERFRVGHPECRLFSSQSVHDGVIELSEWLSTHHEFTSDDRLQSTMVLSGDDMKLGFKGGGWTIVTPNCPTNSLPVLWYSRDNFYEGPFPRIMSRTSQKKGASGLFVNTVIDKCATILQILEDHVA